MKLRTIFIISITIIFPLAISAQQTARPPAQEPLFQWMDRIAQQQLQQREDAIAKIHTVAEAGSRQKWVRATLLDLLGGLPDYQGPLNARITGRIQAEGYTIENLIFESLPHFYVTANLYRPNSAGRYPAVLLQAGHTQEGKPAEQRIAANLALKGFVVLAFDPIGQGEREQTYDRLTSRPAAGWSVNEHLHAGAQSILVGEGVARYFIWDAMRAIDYLTSRPEVDASRIGAMGCSGGGALTTFVGGMDPRVKAVVPACFPNSYRLLFGVRDGPDAEMSFPRFLASHLDTTDFTELSAPTPWLIMETDGDYFTPAGAKIMYEEAKRWYALYGAEDKVEFFVGHGPHGTPLENREAIYKWMIRWLKDDKGDFHEQPTPVYNNFQLLATRTGHVEDLPGSLKLHQLILANYRARRRPGTVPELLAELRRLGIPSDGAPPEVKVAGESTTADEQRQEIKFASEPGVEISGRLYIPNGPGRKPAVLLVAAGRTTSALAESLARAGRVVLELEPRDCPTQVDNRPYVGNWYTNWRADQIGRNLAAMRAHDILRGVDVLAARPDVDPASIRGAARSVQGVLLLLAAAADNRVSGVWLDRTPHSLEAALERPIAAELFDAVIPGFLLHWDLADLVGAMGNRRVLWTDPTDWMDGVVPLGSEYRYRYVLFGGLPLYREEQEKVILDEFLK